MQLKFLLIFLLVFVCGCSATGQKYSELAPAATSGKSEIVIYRKTNLLLLAVVIELNWMVRK